MKENGVLSYSVQVVKGMTCCGGITWTPGSVAECRHLSPDGIRAAVHRGQRCSSDLHHDDRLEVKECLSRSVNSVRFSTFDVHLDEVDPRKIHLLHISVEPNG